MRTRVINIKIVPRLSDRADKAVVESSDGGDGDDGEKLYTRAGRVGPLILTV